MNVDRTGDGHASGVCPDLGEPSFRELVENLNDVVYVVSLAGEICYVTPSIERISGYTPDEVLGREYLEFVHTHDRAEIQASFLRTMGGLREDSEYRMMRKDGSPLWVRTSSKPILVDGQPVGARGVLVDISERKAGEAALRQASEQSQAILDSISDAFMALDDQLVVTYFNNAAERLLGRSREDLLGRFLFDAFPEARGSEFDWRYRRAVKERQEDNFEVFFDVEPYCDWYDVRVFPQENGISVYFRVTTTRRQVEEALQQSAERFRTLFMTSLDGILLADTQTGELLLANPAICGMLGYAEAELCAFKVADIHPPEALSDVVQSFQDRLDGRSSRMMDVPLRRKDGTIFYADISPARVSMDGRDVLIASFRDLTERRRSVASLAQSERMASMGVLAASVAHEINNPLAYLIYNLESLAGDLPAVLSEQQRLHGTGRHAETWSPASEDPDDMAARFADVLDGARRIADIVGGLATFSRTGREDLRPLDPQRVLEGTCALTSSQLRYRARLLKELAPVPKVMASEAQLCQVFMNLLLNAGQAIDEGDVDNNEVAVRLWEENGTVCVEVRDTGHGIPPAHMEHIFEPFFTTRDVGQGSGLGLYITKNLVEGFGGHIAVSSQEGRGTRVLVTLPVAAVAHPSSGASVARIAASGERPTTGRVLVVDDEEAVRRAMVRILRRYEVWEASSSAEARQIICEEGEFDAVICDVMMPGELGTDLHRWLCAEHPALGRRVIFVTGGAFAEPARNYLDAVANPCLAKPFEPAKFLDIVHQTVQAGYSPECYMGAGGAP